MILLYIVRATDCWYFNKIRVRTHNKYNIHSCDNINKITKTVYYVLYFIPFCFLHIDFKYIYIYIERFKTQT